MSSPEPAPRLLRAFLAVAEELHFTRAAARLYVAQQALSRDVRRLEAELGTELLVRSTRRAELTPDGERFVPYARRVLAAYEELGSAFGQARPLLVDVNSPGLVFERVLEHARRLVPELEVMARYESGLTGAALEIGAGRLDASFGRWAGLEPALRDQLDHQPVRLEPMAVVLPEDHPLAALAEVPLGALAGEYVYAGAGNPRTPEWTGLARALFAGRGIRVSPPAPLAVGREEFERVMAKYRHPVLAVVDFPPMPGCVLRPLTDPVPLSPVSLVWRKGLRHPALDAVRSAAATLARAERWLEAPPGSWLPEADRQSMGQP
ncbi:LysR family transcriptional regulator [Streptomyces albidoflavus]|uniref:LysR family transcriptional regulator n=1 Tax=Streptomyces albidoflavus TaxID=1886 RepID=UPI00101E5CA4|nr:LysR family transcriptional regulator [Streptomyces albidoflavus]RZD81109.1 LysR family transcriptional regulator [Streptomyces albidoflavus]RZE04119.1 LysR family transcriptional regulator [Streptomyces albidoflavus]RZE04231.1 LysR family transcriptional regulator [Streptomyces albidoflavus]